MFCSRCQTPPRRRAARRLRERATDALRLLGAFLTLEDDYDVDWDFPGEGPAGGGVSPAPRHVRVPTCHAFGSTNTAGPFRRRASPRRPGPPAPVTPCLAPLPPRPGSPPAATARPAIAEDRPAGRSAFAAGDASLLCRRIAIDPAMVRSHIDAPGHRPLGSAAAARLLRRRLARGRHLRCRGRRSGPAPRRALRGRCASSSRCSPRRPRSPRCQSVGRADPAPGTTIETPVASQSPDASTVSESFVQLLRPAPELGSAASRGLRLDRVPALPRQRRADRPETGGRDHGLRARRQRGPQPGSTSSPATSSRTRPPPVATSRCGRSIGARTASTTRPGSTQQPPRTTRSSRTTTTGADWRSADSTFAGWVTPSAGQWLYHVGLAADGARLLRRPALQPPRSRPAPSQGDLRRAFDRRAGARRVRELELRRRPVQRCRRRLQPVRGVRRLRHDAHRQQHRRARARLLRECPHRARQQLEHARSPTCRRSPRRRSSSPTCSASAPTTTRRAPIFLPIFPRPRAVALANRLLFSQHAAQLLPRLPDDPGLPAHQRGLARRRVRQQLRAHLRPAREPRLLHGRSARREALPASRRSDAGDPDTSRSSPSTRG